MAPSDENEYRAEDLLEPIRRQEARMGAIRQQFDALLSKSRPLESTERRDEAIQSIVEDESPEARQIERQLLDGNIKGAVASMEQRAQKTTESKSTDTNAVEDWKRIADLVADIDFKRAWKAYEEAHRLDPSNVWVAVMTARCRYQGGKLEDAVQVALTADKQASTPREKLVASSQLGDLYTRLSPKLAPDYFRRALKVAQEFVASTPGSLPAKRDLSVSHNKLGDALARSGNAKEAREAFEESMNLAKELVTANPDNPRAKRDLSICHERLGTVLSAESNLEEAQGHFENSLKLRQKLSAPSPENAEAKRDLSIAYEKLGDILFKNGKLKEALDQYRMTEKLRTELVDANPDDTLCKHDLAVAYWKLGAHYEAMSQFSDAASYYRQSTSIFVGLALSFPSEKPFGRDLRHASSDLARMEAKLKETAKS